MKGRMCAYVAITVLAVVPMLYLAYDAKGADAEPKSEANANLAAKAREVLMDVEATYVVGRATAEDLHTWSMRIVQAENYSADAIAEHLKRMKELHKEVSAMFSVGAEGGEVRSLHAVEYYVLEAEQLTAR